MAEKLIKLINEVSDEFYEKSMELAEIATRKASAWMEIRKVGSYTIAETDKIWEATEDGKREVYLRIYLRGLQAKRGALILEHKADSGSNFL